MFLRYTKINTIMRLLMMGYERLFKANGKCSQRDHKIVTGMAVLSCQMVVMLMDKLIQCNVRI